MFNPETTVPSTQPDGISSVLVEPRCFDWDRITDPEALANERSRLKWPRLRQLCYYQNPGYIVISTEPTLAFFQGVEDADSRWITRCQEILDDQPELDEYRKRNLIDCGMFLGGTLFIKGQLLPRKLWEQMASDQVPSPFNTGLKVTWRIPDLESLAASADPEPLKAVVQHELSLHLATDPKPSLFVTPGFTVSKASGCLEFLHTARQRQTLWQSWVKDTLGKVRFKELKAATDLITRMTVYLGTLVVDGQIYVPGLWPDDKVTTKKLLNKSFSSPTLPPEYFGLESSI